MTDRPPLTGEHPFDWVDDIMYILDDAGRFTFANTAALNAWGKQPHALLGLTLEEALPNRATQEIQDAFTHALHAQQRREFEAHLIQGGWFNFMLYPHHGGLVVHARPLPRHAGTFVPADFDALTGCLTRAAFQRALKGLDLPRTLAIIDLNRLKSINARKGHSGGDAHIRTTAQAVQQALPTGALMCRWGGDEFVLLTPDEDRDALHALLEHVETTLPGPGQDLTTYAVGLAVWEAGTPFERTFALADEHLQRRKAQLEEAAPGTTDLYAFVAFSQRLEALRNPDEIIQHALDNLLILLDFDQAFYLQWEGQQDFISHQALRSGSPQPSPAMGVRTPIAGYVLKVQGTRTTAWSTDYPSEVDVSPRQLASGVKSGIVTPVFSQGQVVATIVLRTINRWQTITPHMIKTVELTALRLEHALELRRAVSEVRRTLEAGLLTLGIVLEARDFETQGHTTRAASMAQALGERLGLNSTDLAHLREGAYLHDLGKLCISDEILRKPGRLTAEEWAGMQSHVLQGHDLATRIPGLPQGILDVIRSHHERWDGSGYPDALSGTDIPLSARIFAVCDVYDALISHRPYKDAWTHEEAAVEIERQAGRHFDPDVVRAFLHLTRHHPDSRDAGKHDSN